MQSLGPMTRTIGSRICNTKQGNPGTAANQFVCLDGSAVMAGVAGVSAASCDLSYTPGHSHRLAERPAHDLRGRWSG